MWLTKMFTAMLAILTGLLPSSCTKAKNSSAQKPHTPVVAQSSNQIPKTTNSPAANIVASAQSLTNRDLGELSLTNHYETCLDLGAGKSCTFKPTLLDHSNLQLTMTVETKNVAGQTKGLSVVQFVTKSGKPFEVAVGDMNLTLTPKLQRE
jgi:hypothetical protein